MSDRHRLSPVVTVIACLLGWAACVSAADNPRYGIYAPVTLSADLTHLSADQRKMIGVLIDASDIMNDLFWRQAYGDREALIAATHLLRPAEADALGAEISGLLGVFRRIGVGPDVHFPVLVRPFHNDGEVLADIP